MAENIEKRLKIELPDGRKGNVSESKLEGLKNKYPELKIVGYMDGSAYEPTTPTQEQPQQKAINIADASMPTDSVQMMNNIPIGAELPPVDANNEDILAQQYARYQLKNNTEEAYRRLSAQAKPIYDKAIDEQVQRNTFDTENKEGKSFFRRLAEFTGRIAPRGGNRVNFADDTYLTNTEVRDYTDALSQLSEAKNLIKDAEAEKDGTFVGGFVRGAEDKLFDVDTWTGGVSESLKSQNLLTALDKFDSGKELTEGEEALLEATAINSAVSELYSGMLGRGYKAGQVTAESIPFMIEMMSNPASGFGNATSKRLARWAVSKGLGRATTKAVGYGGRVAGDIIGSNLMSMTTGSGRVVAGALDRDMGRLNYALDEDGAIKFVGAEGSDDSFIRSLVKSYGSNTITNFSEMLGAYFAPLSSLGKKGMGRLMKHFPSMQKVEDVFKSMKLNDAATFFKQMDKETQLSGVFGEFAEEIADGLMQGVIVDDKSFGETAEEVFDKDNLIDTFLGVSFFGGVRTLAKTAGAARYGFDLAQMYQDRAEKQALRSGIDEDTWNYEKGKIDTWSSDEYEDDGYKELVSYLNQRSTDDAFTTDQKVALFNYAKAVQQAKGITLATQKAQEEGIDSTVAAEEDDIQSSVDTEQQSPIDLNDEETVLANLGLTGKDNIRYQKIEDGKRIYTNSVIPAKITDENGEELNGYLLRESQGVQGLAPTSEVMIIGSDGAYKAVVKSDRVIADNPIDDSSFFSSVASEMRKAKEDEVKRFNEANQDSIEQEMTPEQRLANRRATFNEKVRNNPNYDEQVYQSSFDLRGQKLRNLTEEQSFVVDMKENGLDTAVEDIFYQRGLIEKAIEDSRAKEADMKSKGKDLNDILKERDKRRAQEKRLNDINKIIDERGLQTPVSQPTSTMVSAVEDALDGTQKPQTMLESVEGVLGGEREAVDKKYIDKSNITAPSEQNPILDTYNSIPRDKSGKVKIKDLSPEQMYSKVFVENGEQAANEMLQEEVDSINEEITKLREELPKKKGLQKAELYDKIGELESRLNSVQAIRPEQTTEAAPTPAPAPEVAPETAPVTEPEVTPEPEVETEPEPQPEPIPDAEQKVVEEPVTEYAQQEDVEKKEKLPKEEKAKVLPKSMKDLKKLSGDELKNTLVQMMQKGLVKFGSKRSWVEMFGERLEKVKDVNALMKKIDPSYEPKKQLYLAVRDLRSLIKETPDSTPQTEEATSPEVKEPVVEFEKKEKTEAKEKKQKKHISLAELRAMSADELKNTLIQLAQDDQIRIYRKNKGVRIGKTVYSKGVIDELLKRIDPKYEITKSIYNTKQKLREIAQIKPKSAETPVANEELDNAEEPIVNDAESKEEVYVTYKGKEVTLQSLIDTYRSLYDAVENNKKKAKTAIGDIAQKYIPQEMKAIGDFLDENGIDRGVLDNTSGEKKAVSKKSETPKVNEEEQKPQESDNVVEDGYEVVEVTKDGKKEKRVMLNPDDYLKRRVYWAREELKKAKKEGKDKDTIKRLENEIQVLNKTAQERGIKSTKDARKGDAALAQEYANTPYGKREIEHYNNAQSFEYDVIEQPKSQSNWIPNSIKKMAVELVKEIPNLNSETTTQQGAFAMKKVDDKNNLFVRVNNNGIAEYYYGTEKQPKSELFKPIEYDQRILTKEEKDFTKESIDSYADYLSAGEQMRAMKFEGLKVDEKKEVMAQRNIIQQKRDQWKKEHRDEIKEWQSKSSMRFEKSKDNGKSEEIELSAEDKAAIEEALSGEINLDEGQGELFNPKDYRFQVSSKGASNTRRATISEVKTLVDAISAVFPSGYNKVKILSGKKFSEAMSALKGRRFANDNGATCGFVAPEGTVYINQDEARIDTPLHEIGIHRLVDLAKDTDNKDMLKAIFEYARTTPREIIEEVHKLYPNLDTRSDAFWEEVAAKAFGLQNEGRLEAMLQTEADKAWWKKLVEAVKNLWNKIAKTEPTYKDMSLYQGLSSLGHEEIGKKLFDMLTSEGNIDLGEISPKRLATQSILTSLHNAGIEVIEATDEMAHQIIQAEMQKRKALETVSIQDEYQQTVISSAYGANVLKDLDSAIEKYENDIKTNEKTFLGNVAKILGAKAQGSDSQYATFEAVNGNVFTIRLSNHNAKVSTFDKHNESEGISIVISAKDNNKVLNDGDAHIVEYFYDAIKLRKADGKPLVEILKSIKQALYSGQYKDTTGLADVDDVNNPEIMAEFQIVYHGSGAKFNKFDHSFMGTGEGAQAYGWGSYTTQVKQIGEAYAAQVSRGGKRYLYTVRIPDDNGSNYLDWQYVSLNQKSRIIDTYYKLSGRRKGSAENFESQISKSRTGADIYKVLKNQFKEEFDKNASYLLLESGIIGVSVPTNFTTRGNADKTKNYIIFDEKDLRIKKRVELMQSKDGTIYGWAMDGKVYLTKDGFNPNTPIHEYTHIWAKAMKKNNPKGWESIKDLLKDTPIWDEVLNDSNYENIKEYEDSVASEVLSRISGSENANRMEKDAQRILDEAKDDTAKSKVQELINRVKEALNKFWNWVGTELFNIENFESVEQVTDRVLYDLMNGTDIGVNNNNINTNNSQTSFSIDIPNTDELINGVLTRRGEERMQRASQSTSAIQSALYDADCPDAAHPAAWINYFKGKGAMDTKGKSRIGQNMYQWLSSQNSVKVIKRDEIIKQNKKQKFKDSPLRNSWDRFISYIADSDLAVRQIQDEVKRLIGIDNIDVSEDFVKAHNLESSKIARKMEVFQQTLHKGLEAAYRNFSKYNDDFKSNPIIDRPFNEAVDRYLFALHAKERNRKVNIDNLVKSAMKYADNIEIKKSDLEFMLRSWITRLYDDHFLSPNGVSLTEFSDTIDPKWKNIAENVERRVLKDFQGVIADNNQTGEDLSDSQAEEYISEFESIVNEAETDTLKTAVKNTTDYILNESLESGLISQATYNDYKNLYQFYVPLRSWENDEAIDANERLNSSYYTGISSVTGEAEVEKKAKGRQTAAASPIATLLSEAQDTIVRGERNRTLNTLVNLFNNYRLEIDDMVYVSEVEDIDKDRFAPAWVTEMAKMNMEEGEEHTIGVRIDGQKRRLYIAGDNGKMFVRAYKNLDATQKGWEWMRRFTKFRSRVATTYNPRFWVSNVERDISGGVRNIYIQRDAEYAKDIVKNLASALEESFNYNVNGKESDMFKLYLDNGGSISYYKQEEVKDIIKNTKKKAEKYIKKGMKEDKAILKAMNETMTNLASVTEEMVRYAAFKTAIQHGELPAEAAYLAHEVTTNLARRGSQRTYSNLYSFFNPSVQGVYQMYTNFADPKTRKRAAVAYGSDIALTLVSKVAMMALTAAIFNGDKDDDEKIGVFDKENPYWDIDENVRNNTVAIPVGIDENGIPQCILFQRPHQFRAVSSIVDYGLENVVGRTDGKEFLNKYLKRMISETAPFNAGSYGENGMFWGAVQQFTPSIARPVADVAVNANAFGGKIRREEYSKSQPEYLLGKGSGVKVYTSISKALNNIGGGSAGIRGSWLQVNPDDIKYLVESYTGIGGQLVHGVTNSLTRNEAEKKRYGGSFANIFGNIYWENRDGAMYQASEKLREYADQYIENLLNNPNPHLIMEFVNDKKTMERITDKATLIATSMYSEYKQKIKELENSWNIVLSDENLSQDEQNAILESILEGLVEVNTGLGKGFEDVLNQVIKEEKR